MTLDELDEAFQRGEVTADTRVYTSGMRTWETLRVLARLDEPEKRWKFSRGDLAERKLWGEYMAAYEDALTRCNTADAPWHIIPSDRKWYRNLVVSRLLLKTLQRLGPQFPPAEEGLEGIVVE